MVKVRVPTRLHSVLSAFQLVALAEQLRNIRKPTCSTKLLLHQRNSMLQACSRQHIVQAIRCCKVNSMAACLGNLVCCVTEVCASCGL